MNLKSRINSNEKGTSKKRNLPNPENILEVKKIHARMIVFKGSVIVIDTKTLPDGLSSNVLQDEVDKAESLEEILTEMKSVNIKCWVCHSAVKMSYGSFYEDSDNKLILIRAFRDKFIITSAQLDDFQYREVDIEE